MTVSAGNGAPPQDRSEGVPPRPRNPVYDRRPPPRTVAEEMQAKLAEHERAKLAADEAEAARPPMPPAKSLDPSIDFMARVNDAASLLADVGSELGHVGQDDAQAMQKFADSMRDSTRRYIGNLIERKRRELNDLERILGKL